MMIMSKQRVTQHSGRTARNGNAFSQKHNDRNYDFELSDNIKENLTDNNFYFNLYDGGYRHKEKEGKLSFEEAEMKYYEEHFLEQWKNTNDKYIKNYHPERCKSFSDWCKQKSNLPEEVILQIGNTENHSDFNALSKVYNIYNKKLEAWNQQHGNPFKKLSMAAHNDEAVPHIHMRRIWQFKDSKGNMCIGQEKALKMANMELPDPSKPEGRYNNRKMTFDKMTRDMWIEACKEVGLDIETVPVIGGKHNLSKEETLENKVKAKEKELEQREANLVNRENQLIQREYNIGVKERLSDEFDVEKARIESTVNLYSMTKYLETHEVNGKSLYNHYSDDLKTQQAKTDKLLRDLKRKYPNISKGKSNGYDFDM